MSPRSSASERVRRARCRRLRQDGHPICSSAKGYYYARTQDDINATVSRLNELVTGVSNARTGLLYARIVPEIPVEIVIRLGSTV